MISLVSWQQKEISKLQTGESLGHEAWNGTHLVLLTTSLQITEAERPNEEGIHPSLGRDSASCSAPDWPFTWNEGAKPVGLAGDVSSEELPAWALAHTSNS